MAVVTTVIMSLFVGLVCEGCLCYVAWNCRSPGVTVSSESFKFVENRLYAAVCQLRQMSSMARLVSPLYELCVGGYPSELSQMSDQSVLAPCGAGRVDRAWPRRRHGEATPSVFSVLGPCHAATGRAPSHFDCGVTQNLSWNCVR